MRIKVDYSIECKRTRKHNILGEFAIYTKDGFFEPWIEIETFASYDIACLTAKMLRTKHGKVPKYF